MTLTLTPVASGSLGLRSPLYGGTSRTDIGSSVFFDFEMSGSGPGGTIVGDQSLGPECGTPGANFGYFLISSDDVAQTANWGYVNGFQIEHHYGGAAAKGGRQSFVVNSVFDGGATAVGAENITSHFYTSIQSNWYGTVNDGGSAGDWRGVGIGISSVAFADAGATYFYSVHPGEFTLVLAANTHCYRATGVMITTSKFAYADGYDAAIAISGLDASPGHVGFKDGILIGDMNTSGATALDSTSTVVRVINHTALTNGFDFSTTTFSGFVLKTNGFTINAPAGDHSIIMGRQDGVASFPTIYFHSGSTFAGYDSAISASGGTGVTGQGFLSVVAAEFTISGSSTGTAPLNVNALSGQTADLADFQVNSATKLAVLASGQIKNVAANETTGAGSAALGANSPAVTNTAPYKWLKFTTSDGSQVYVPAWK